MQEINYIQSGDYLIPDLELFEQKPVGKYGRARLRYLKEHRHGYYAALLLTGEINKHLCEIDEQADIILNQYITEALKTAPDKATHQMEWVGYMNNAKASAEEVINAELIYR